MLDPFDVFGRGRAGSQPARRLHSTTCMPNIFHAIQADHDRQRNLLARLAETHGDSSARRGQWELLRFELEAHARAEERVLYARLMQSAETREPAAHSVAEHETMRCLVEELDQTDMSSPGWIATFRKLREAVEHHLGEEESSIFDRARELMQPQTLDDLRVAFQRKRAEAEHELAGMPREAAAP